MSIKTETKTLMCCLSEPELLERGDELAKTYMKVAALDMEKKRITARIKPLDERIELLVTIIDTKEEERPVDCEWQFDFAQNIKRLRRLDTGEVIDTKEIKDWERQQQLALDAEAGEQPSSNKPCWNSSCAWSDLAQEDHCDALFNPRRGRPVIECKCFVDGIGPTRGQNAAACFNTGCDSNDPDVPSCCETWEEVEMCPQFVSAGWGAFENDGPEGANARPETEEKAEGSEASDEVAGSAAGDADVTPIVHSLCITCLGNCGDFTPGTHVSECPGFNCEITAVEIERRTNICPDWEKCEHRDLCFTPANEDAGVCLSEMSPGYLDQVKAKRASGMSLSDAVASVSPTPAASEFGCKICGFDAGTKIYLSRHVEREHNMTASQYKKAFPANKTALDVAREKRAKLIRGAK